MSTLRACRLTRGTIGCGLIGLIAILGAAGWRASIDHGARPAKNDAPVTRVFSEAVSATVLVRVSNSDGVCREGSGVLVGGGHYVLTNAHVATGSTSGPPYILKPPPDPACTKVSIGVLEATQLTPEQWLSAEVVQSRPTVDLALLQITDPNAPELPSAIIDDSEMKLGDNIYLIGFPDYGSDSVVLTDGMVAGRYEADYGYFVMATAAISGGNSGGPAISAEGTVVGISTLGAPVQIICTEEENNDNWCSLKRSQIALVRPVMFAQPLLNLIGKATKSP